MSELVEVSDTSVGCWPVNERRDRLDEQPNDLTAITASFLDEMSGTSIPTLLQCRRRVAERLHSFRDELQHASTSKECSAFGIGQVREPIEVDPVRTKCSGEAGKDPRRIVEPFAVVFSVPDGFAFGRPQTGHHRYAKRHVIEPPLVDPVSWCARVVELGQRKLGACPEVGKHFDGGQINGYSPLCRGRGVL